MKNTVYFIIFTTIFGCNHVKVENDCYISSKKTFNIDSIIKEQKTKLLDTVILKSFGTHIQQNIKLLEKAKHDKSVLYPFVQVDSSVYVRYKDIAPLKPAPLSIEEQEVDYIKILCSNKTKEVINFFNNPNNFGFGECGTFIPEAQIKFYSKGKKIAHITFGCDHQQIDIEPIHPLVNWGGMANDILKTFNFK